MIHRLTAPTSLAAIGVTAALAVGGAAAMANGPTSDFTANLVPYTTAHAGVAPNSGVSASATVLTPAGQDTSIVRLHAEGLAPGHTYGAHVHYGTCSEFLGHFRYNPAGPGTRANEVWLDLEANPAGRADDQVKVPSFAASGYSVVIHEQSNPDQVTDPAGHPGGRIACGDLRARP